MQTAGDLVAAAAELSTGVQDGQGEGRGRKLLAGRDVGRDATTVVGDADRTVVVERDDDGVAVAGEGLVDRVVDDLPDQVVEAADTGRADVHTGTLAHRFQAFEDLDRRAS